MALKKNYLLYPFSLVYGLITDVRNLLYDSGILYSKSFDTPVISVGNITVGGTGKTPHTEYLAGLLSKNYKVAVLSRGYGRKTKGYLEVEPLSRATDAGDEPLQIATGFPEILVAVEGNRVSGIKTILERHPETNVVILDDAFQHRRIKAGQSILLTDYYRLISRDSILPFGRLRERWTNALRADIIIVTKSPVNLTVKEMDELKKELRIKSQQELFFTTTSYADPKPVFDISFEPIHLSESEKESEGAVLVTGIASPQPLKLYLQQYFREIIHMSFPDHHYFDSKDLRRIAEALESIKSSRKLILTTSKDAVRLREFSNIDPELRKAFFYIPVGVSFHSSGEIGFDKTIFDYVGKNKKNNPVP